MTETKVKLQNGPCDPREVTMRVSIDADAVFIRPMPFDVEDVYAVVDTFIDNETLTHATGEYLYTKGTRQQINAYRRGLTRIGAGRAFKIKRQKDIRVH